MRQSAAAHQTRRSCLDYGHSQQGGRATKYRLFDAKGAKKKHASAEDVEGEVSSGLEALRQQRADLLSQLRRLDIRIERQERNEPVNFMSLPAELRNRIYDLSGCLKVYQCRICSTTVFGDCGAIHYEHLSKRTTDGPPRKFYRWPYIVRDCCKWKKGTRHCGHAHRSTLLWVNRQGKTASHHDCTCRGAVHSHQRVARSVQLAIAQVSKSVRAETLGIFHASNHFFATIFDTPKDRGVIMRWLKSIGPENASKITSFHIVYSRNEQLRFVKKKLVKKMKEMGLRVDDGVVEATKLKAPFCRCEHCVMQTLRDKSRHKPSSPKNYKFGARDC
ncbi:uncharacterized protein MYCFIDRAFT_82809 [Pseudocercospora fijiensis CIRAD86]|uniref:Uncharacterized protein n=1 Tax=Pseudocercospora fijiensis (strain CIRAD86) TaxID=383855 RepID=M3AJG1_PSEFD|nr:uncharacterized protein MYCFIDRAFT_82809 [Pseudocercospora fijiensis CIRAD86]EME84711.1 hypothetical protein MYCFIDRAFT_82809 [Pseudocercospora fijiensis CIRAD86]